MNVQIRNWQHRLAAAWGKDQKCQCGGGGLADGSPTGRSSAAMGPIQRLTMELGPDGIADTWLRPGGDNGYDITPLSTPRDLFTESVVMHNCVNKYGSALISGECRLFSVSLSGKKLAALEVCPKHKEGRLSVTNLKGPFNRSCSIDLRRAAAHWLEGQPHSIPEKLTAEALPPPSCQLQDILRPYCQACGLTAKGWPASLTLEQFYRANARLAGQLGSARAPAIVNCWAASICAAARLG